MRRPPYSVLFASMLLLIAAFACTSTKDAPSAKELAAVDEPLPTIEGDTLDGGTLAPGGAGKPMVFNAWASWCYPCREEQPMLNELYERYGDQVEFVGVNSKDTDAAAAEHAREFAIPYPSLDDPDGKIAIQQLGIDTGLPGTVVVDASGQIRYRVKGRITQEMLEPMIEELLAGSPTAAPSPAA